VQQRTTESNKKINKTSPAKMYLQLIFICDNETLTSVLSSPYKLKLYFAKRNLAMGSKRTEKNQESKTVQTI